ncbi:MAG: response regulator [bacterium]|jgi:CheY-like chemotaxis protein/glycine cleavage system H lipoate-binding protein
MERADSGAKIGKILLVEDEPVVVAAVEKILCYEQIQVVSVSDVSSAREIFESSKFSAVIADLMLPGESGAELLKETINTSPETPVLVISGFATIDNAIRLLRLGAFDFIPKPFSFEELTSVLARIKRYLSIPSITRSLLICCLRSAGDAPGKRLCLRGHTWVEFDSDGNANIGIASLMALTCGIVETARFPNSGEQIICGQYCGTLVDSEGNEHGVRAPLSGEVLKSVRLEELDVVATHEVHSGERPFLVIRPSQPDREVANLVRCARF